jgi:hypothetical protein
MLGPVKVDKAEQLLALELSTDDPAEREGGIAR